MSITKQAITKIEEELYQEMDIAAAKRDTNRMVAALVESVKQLVAVAKETVEAMEGVKAATDEKPKPVEPVVKAEAAKTPAKPAK